MLTEKYYTNFYAPDNADSMEESGDPVIIKDDPILTDDSQETSYEPGTVIIEEQTVTTVGDEVANAGLQVDEAIEPPPELAISFNGTLYKVPRIEINSALIYGNANQQTGPDFSKYPFAIVCLTGSWALYTPEPGTYTISAKIPDGKGTPKILRITKVPRTVLNQLCRVSKALRSSSNKNTDGLDPSTQVEVNPGDLDPNIPEPIDS